MICALDLVVAAVHAAGRMGDRDGLEALRLMDDLL